MSVGPAKAVRSMNLAIRDLARQGNDGAAAEWNFFCECGCRAVVHMTLAEFDAADGVYTDGHRVGPGSRPGKSRAA